MGITRPTGEQLRFRSATTGDHILDTYMENSEKGSRTLPDLMDDLFDSNGVFRAANFEFRFDATADKIQFRAGNFANSNTGWTDITTFFDITGTFNASTTYNNFDLLTLTNKDVYIVHGLSSSTTFADEAAVIASANTEKLVDVSEARDWASKTNGQVVSTDYSSKAYAVGGTGIDTTTGSAKDWAIKTSSTVGNTGEYSAKYWATSTAVTTVSSGIANINTVAAAIANVNTTATNISNVNTVAGISADVTSVANIDSNVTTVAGISANTTTVAGIASNVTTVAGISANVTTVAGIASNVTTVANNNTDISTVATNVADLQTVADEIDNNNLQTVANDIAAVITAADDLNESTSEIEVVANAITNVDLVGGSIANVNTVGTNIANVNTTATNIANVNTVAGISSNVTTVATNNANVTTVASNNANISTVAGISSNVTTVAGISSNVTTVAGIAADVTTAASNVTAFNNTYLGAQSSAPTQDPDGSALDVGDLYFDTSTNTMRVYAQSGWTAAGSSVNGTADRFNYTATAGQTTFTGTDANGNTLSYDSGFADIFMNGVKLAPADYTATNGTSLVLASGAALNDVIEIIAYGTFTLSNQSINDMTDVTTGGITNGQFLQYNSSNSRFEPATVATDLQGDTTPQLGGDLDVNGNDITSSGNITLDASGDIILDADGADISLKDGGTRFGILYNSASNFHIEASVQDKDIKFLGNDGGSGITALTLDMSEAGAATFNGGVVINESGGDNDFRVESDSYSSMLTVDAGANYVGIQNSGNLGGQLNIAGTTGIRGHKTSSYKTASMMRPTAFGYAVGTYAVTMLGDGNTQGTVSIGYDPSSNTSGSFTGTGGEMLFRGDMSFYQPNTADNGYVQQIRMTNDVGVTINEGGADLDFRVESDNNAYAFFVNAGTDQIMFGDSSINATQAQVGISLTTAATPHIVIGNTQSSGNEYLTYYNRQNNDGGILQFRRGNSTKGSVDVSTSGTTYNTTSDRRLKDNIKPIADATDKLMSMKPVTHTWIANPEAPAVHGFIAQEMQEIVPEAVSGEDGGEEMMSMDYGRITPVLVAALQDAMKEITALKERVAELEAK